MQNWKKNRNYRKHVNADGSYTYIITVDGVNVEVSAEVYKVYVSTERKMEYMERDLKRDRVLKDAGSRAVRDDDGHSIVLLEREVSLEKLMDEGWDCSSAELSPEDEVMRQFEIKELHNCLDLLSADERELINALFFEELTIREYAELTGKSKSSIDRQKAKILARLKNILTN